MPLPGTWQQSVHSLTALAPTSMSGGYSMGPSICSRSVAMRASASIAISAELLMALLLPADVASSALALMLCEERGGAAGQVKRMIEHAVSVPKPGAQSSIHNHSRHTHKADCPRSAHASSVITGNLHCTAHVQQPSCHPRPGVCPASWQAPCSPAP